MKKSILFFYLISTVCLIACSPKKNNCQINGVIVNPSEKNIKIGEQTIPISENGKFYYRQEIERPMFLDVSYSDLEWTLFLTPKSNFTLLIPEKKINAIEYKGDLVPSNTYLLEINSISDKINEDLRKNWYAIHKQNQTDYIASIDSLKSLYWEHLANDTLRQVKKSQAFINAWKAEINFAFNKFMTYYPKNHFYYTGEKVQLSDQSSDYIYLSEIDSLTCFDLPSYKDYAGDWIDLKSENLAQKDTSLRNFHLKKLEATNKIIHLAFTNQFLKDYWLTKYIKEHLESQGISNSEKYISLFKESCKTDVFKKEIEEYLASVLKEREDHEVKIYKTENGFNLEAHVFTPENMQDKEKRPAIVIVHGGGWNTGNPSWAFDEANHFKDLGMVAIAAQYRLTNNHDVTALESMADIRDLIMWMRINSDSLGIQPDSIAAYGWSAGGHLISSSAIFCDSIPEQGVNSIPNSMILISPAVSLPKSDKGWKYRVFGAKATISSANPVEHVRKGLPPTIILQGRDDTLTPLSGVQLFNDKMQENGNYCEIWIYDGVGHLFTPNSMSDRGEPKPDKTVKKKAYRKIDEFLKNLAYIKELNYEMDFGSINSQNMDKIWSPTTMINDVTFKDSKFDRFNIGCGFLLKYNQDTFAITAKHIICIAKTDSMITTNFENGLKQWIMYPKDKKEQTVIMDRLLNEDKTDSLSFDFMDRHDTTYNDYLVFKIKQNNSRIKPLEIRKTKLKVGETLYAIGWTYKDRVGVQRVYKYSYHESKGTRFNMKIIDAPRNGGGLSGSPVIDADGLLVGIISGMDEDPMTKEQYYSPRNTDYLVDFFNDYYR